MNLGRMLGIPYFLTDSGEQAVVESNKEVNAAIRKYRKQRREDGDESLEKVLVLCPAECRVNSLLPISSA